MKHMLGVNCSGISCLGRWILRVPAVYSRIKICSSMFAQLEGVKFNMTAKEMSRQMEYSSSMGMYKAMYTVHIIPPVNLEKCII